MGFAMQYCVVVPARFESTRFPGKPLADIGGIPMIIRTVRQCWQAVGREVVFVATDDHRIADVCAHHGVNCVLTSRKCLTGTDRVAEFATTVKASTYINIQGDEPLFAPDDIQKLVVTAQQNPSAVLNGYCAIDSELDYRNPMIPKVVMNCREKLLYMSRAAIPSSKSEHFCGAHRQVCGYAFPARALRVFASQEKKTPLEEVEDIEILRFLELGWDVQMLRMSNKSISVDRPEDITRVEAIISGT